jgi:hypothetical protein
MTSVERNNKTEPRKVENNFDLVSVAKQYQNRTFIGDLINENLGFEKP